MSVILVVIEMESLFNGERSLYEYHEFKPGLIL